MVSRHVRVRAHRKREDFAEIIRELCDEVYLDAEKSVLVLANLNTHGTGSLYQAFVPAEAKCQAEKLEIHYTPKHGCWLNMAEIKLSVLSHQRISDYFETREHWPRRFASGNALAMKTKRVSTGDLLPPMPESN